MNQGGIQGSLSFIHERSATFDSAAMYAIAGSFLRKGGIRLRWKDDWPSSSSLRYPNRSAKFYHSENGVYGYKSKPQTHYEVPKECMEVRSKYSNFYRLVTAYREHAHKQANVNPIAIGKPTPVPELQLEKFGLRLTDRVSYKGILSIDENEGSVEDALRFLKTVYSDSAGVEFSYLDTEEEREWFANYVERHLVESLNNDVRKTIGEEMLRSQTFDNFLAIKFVSLKRYGGEGAESMMAFFHELFKLSAHDGLEQIILCMPHRGRLNLLTGMLKFPPEKLFSKLKGRPEFPEDATATGDVASHFIASTDLHINGKNLHISMLRNPSHLEAVNPVSMGKTRGVMQAIKDGAYSTNPNARWSDKVLNIQVHGDAAYAGQGIDQECLALSGVPHFEIGGTVHLVVNNQVGFTTPPSRGRSSLYCTDVAKMISAPVIHVNADDPEMVVRATRIAFMYQRKFRKDVFIDLNCFRRWGHNELDDPVFTNPLIYKIIKSRPSIPDRYLKELTESDIMSVEEGQAIVEKHNAFLSEALKKTDIYVPQRAYFEGRWSGIKQAKSNVTSWDSGVDLNLLRFVAEKSVAVNEETDVHPQLMKSHVQARLKKIASGDRLDWATAEALAIGSLLYQGYNVRISGQDIGRGTFSHRHAMLVNQTKGDIHIPLNSMIDNQTGHIELANSILSEEAVLGFEYGVSIASPTNLVIWEAQFGDFFNGAQIIIDTFVTSGEAKWMLSSGLTMLLPHGYDGAGPEHSSCRLERFLQLTDSKEHKPDGDDINIQVANPTTPAQYFHLLRRQMVRDYRKPLIVVAPKTLLRHSAATSALSEMEPGTCFKNVIGDNIVDATAVRKIILVTGKHYYALDSHRNSIGDRNVAIIRLESLCPFPIQELLEQIEKYPNAKLFVWSQEEPRNMGAWTFVKPRFENMCGRALKYCGRDTMAAPAVGEGQIHMQEAEQVIIQPFFIKP